MSNHSRDNSSSNCGGSGTPYCTCCPPLAVCPCLDIEPGRHVWHDSRAKATIAFPILFAGGGSCQAPNDKGVAYHHPVGCCAFHQYMDGIIFNEDGSDPERQAMGGCDSSVFCCLPHVGIVVGMMWCLSCFWCGAAPPYSEQPVSNTFLHRYPERVRLPAGTSQRPSGLMTSGGQQQLQKQYQEQDQQHQQQQMSNSVVASHSTVLDTFDCMCTSCLSNS